MSTVVSTGRSERFQSYMRQLALVLSRTPFHPQWFSFRAKIRAADFVANAATGRLLDVGCADAVLRGRTAARCQYVSLDYPVTGKGLYEARPDVFGDAAALPFGSNTFDGVVLLDVLEHLKEPRASLCEIARVLRLGGKLFVNVPCLYPLHDEPHDYQRPTEHGLRHWLTQAGFQVNRIDARGAPAETAALLLNIVLARIAIRLSRFFPPLLLVALLLLPLFALVNFIGWGVGCATRKDDFMPFAYWAIASRVSTPVVGGSA
jgi:SAM-dependent methyltransferase